MSEFDHDKNILKNVAQCKKCNDVIESKHRHDFVRCSCRQIAVDGGKDYLKRLSGSEGYIELSENVEENP